MSGFDLAQTFFIDPDAALSAPSIYVTSIDLFFYSKPVQGKAQSGINSPGVTVYIGDTLSDGSPNLSSVKNTVVARVEYANINVDSTGATATTFTFSRPINLRTNTVAAILIAFDGSDPGFELWHNKAGQVQFGTTNLTNVTTGPVDGSMYVITNGITLTAQKDADLAFKLRVANFATNKTFKVKNRPYEILKLTGTQGNFIGGEPVYVKTANATGTIATVVSNTTIVGTGTTLTSLTAGDSFVITDGTPGNTEVRKVVSVANNTLLTIDVAPTFTNTAAHYYKTVTGTAYFTSGQTDHLVIQNSTSNSTVYVGAGNTIYGVDSLAYATIANVENYGVNAVTPGFVIGVPNGTQIRSSLGFANSSLAFSSATVEDAAAATRILLNKYPAVLASHTTEATTATPFTSLQSTVAFTTTNKYITPYVDEENLDMFVETFQINNDDTNEYTGSGNAQTRYISKTVNLDADQVGEDLKVFVSAYKPSNTDIKVYVRARNSKDSETIDVKSWTELVADTKGIDYSSATNPYDFLEIPYNVPFEPTGTLQTGTFSTALSATITGTSGTVNTGIAVGNIVRVYSPFSANAYFISTVTAANTTTFTVATAVSNTSMVGSGFLVDVVTRKSSGFLDAQNKNVFSYYNSAMSLFQGYDSFALKIVLLSTDGYHVPMVNNIRAIAVSA